jgi:3-hydroxymyristoyl/3-hydroxydecanoyl-(acyl carrier protein) dehydratase
MPDGARDPVVTMERALPDGRALDLEIPADLAWCRGHFPGFPIVPGVVLLRWALAQGRRCFGTGEAEALALQVKFRRPVRPGDRLTLELRHAPAIRRLAFAYRDGEAVCSSGQVTFTP